MQLPKGKELHSHFVFIGEIVVERVVGSRLEANLTFWILILKSQEKRDKINGFSDFLKRKENKPEEIGKCCNFFGFSVIREKKSQGFGP